MYYYTVHERLNDDATMPLPLPISGGLASVSWHMDVSGFSMWAQGQKGINYMPIHKYSEYANLGHK